MPGHRKRRQFKQTDALRGAWNAGATRVTPARVDRRILRQAVAAPQATCTAILQHVQDTLDHSISTRTIFRRLVANGLHSCRPLKRLPLTSPNRRQRLEWCRARSTWMTEWHRVVFSDESRSCLPSDSRRVRVWRRRGERSNPAAIVERPTVRQRGIMVWGAIAYVSRSPLLRIQGTMTAQRYVDDVLRRVTLLYLQGVPNALYQQDNARPHTARISQQALQDVQMLPWPPYSPDLSPIEHVWDIIGRRLHALPQPRSEDELWQMVEREWRAIPQDAIRTLIDSLPRRVAACIAVRDEDTQDAQLKAQKERALAVIALSINTEHQIHIIDCSSPQDAWKNLEQVFEPKSRSRILQLKKQFVNIKLQTGESMLDYLNRLKICMDHLKEAGAEVDDQDIAYSMLSGLPDSFDTLVMSFGNVEDSDFTSNKVRNTLLTEYERRSSREGASSGVKCYRCSKIGHIAKDCRSSINRDYKADKSYSRKKYSFKSPSENMLMAFNAPTMCEPIQTASGNLQVEGVGNIRMKMYLDTGTQGVTMNDVLCVPQARRNLLSVSQTEDKGKHIKICNHKARVFNDNRVICVARNLNGLYIVRALIVPHTLKIEAFVALLIPKQKLKKFDRRAKRCILVGYSTQSKGYRLWDNDSKQVFITKHARFDENEVGLNQLKDDVTEGSEAKNSFVCLPEQGKVLPPRDPDHQTGYDSQLEVRSTSEVRDIVGGSSENTLSLRSREIERKTLNLANVELNLCEVGNNNKVAMFTDADYGSDMDDRRSYSGMVAVIDGNVINWRSKKQQCVSLSTMESEYIALCHNAKEAVWLGQTLSDLGFILHFAKPLTIYCDNRSAIDFSKNNIENNRSKHISVQFHYTRDKMNSGDIVVHFVNTKENMADIQTNTLKKLMHRDACFQMNLKSQVEATEPGVGNPRPKKRVVAKNRRGHDPQRGDGPSGPRTPRVAMAPVAPGPPERRGAPVIPGPPERRGAPVIPGPLERRWPQDPQSGEAPQWPQDPQSGDGPSGLRTPRAARCPSDSRTPRSAMAPGPPERRGAPVAPERRGAPVAPGPPEWRWPQDPPVWREASVLPGLPGWQDVLSSLKSGNK
ncbi:hypothetical protein LAZ67_7001058 [Cordylochernes scorpioides]|uniref:CCHC-type domain-containing protein n=1 Tax=Cordylochernes scorpioides TaxID=51811 RepID=A0ABY6KNH2_9ARAC|nr:hypothetical protein LAZ67_7001058 [Cordylochernes scorpioides]